MWGGGTLFTANGGGPLFTADVGGTLIHCCWGGTGTDTVEIYVDVSQKPKNRTFIWPR